MKIIISLSLLLFFIPSTAQKRVSDKAVNAEEMLTKGEGIMYDHKDSAYYYYDAAIKAFEADKNWLGTITSLEGIIYTSSFHYNLAKYNAALRKMDTLFTMHKSYFDTIPEAKSIKNNQFIYKTNYYTKLKDYKKARFFAAELRKKIEKTNAEHWTKDDVENLVTAYDYEAFSYKEEGKYAIAQQLYEKGLRLTLDHLDEDYAIPTYRLLGGLYRRQKKYLKSNEYLRKNLSFELNSGSKSKNRIVHSCFVIAQNFIKLQKVDSVNHYLSLARRQLSENDPLEYLFHQIKAELNRSTATYPEALQSIDSSITSYTKFYPETPNVQLATLYSEKALIYQELKNYPDALGSYQLSLKALSEDFLSDEITENPVLESVKSKVEFLKILKEKATTLNQYERFDVSIATSELAMVVLDVLKPTFQSEDDKQILVEDAYAVFETGLEATYQQYLTSNEQELIDQAFRYAEKSKSIVLLEAILNAKAYSFSGIPTNLLEKENQLKSTIKNLERKLERSKADVAQEEELFKLTMDYRSLIQNFEERYPSYYDLKHKSTVVSANAVIKELSSNEMLISYFFGVDALYAISISKQNKNFVKIPINDELIEELQKFQNLLSDPSSDIKSLDNLSKTLYQKILKPLMGNQSFSKLIIIPDGLLNYIPFEALHNSTSYLVENTIIGYTNSATLLEQLKEENTNKGNLLAFAPNFGDFISGDSLQFAPLPNNKNEIERIGTHFKGSIFSGGDATLQAFKDRLKSHNIIHLATHAVINDNVPEYSFLAFAPVEDQEYLMYVNDLYATELNANLVTLSACETGVGQLKKGEGMLSLSRAFFYAGASCIAHTLWNVNDNASSQVMIDFYKYLSEGNTKDAALRMAKLDFMEKNRENNLRHPYYWAGIVISGNTAPLVHKGYAIWYTLGVAMLIFVVYLTRKKLFQFSK